MTEIPSESLSNGFPGGLFIEKFGPLGIRGYHLYLASPNRLECRFSKNLE
jgi:hypothetical protein